VERGGFDDDRGAEPADRRADRVGVAELEVLVRERADLVPRERLDDVAPELARRPDDDDPAQNTLPIFCSVSSIEWSRVIHSML
jgi:hypothetical protein